jgi:imidazolonepropionase-like amidohydrolase
VGKQADMIIVKGDPSTNISDVVNVETVFKKGVGYSPTVLVDSVRGHVGLW